MKYVIIYKANNTVYSVNNAELFSNYMLFGIEVPDDYDYSQLEIDKTVFKLEKPLTEEEMEQRFLVKQLKDGKFENLLDVEQKAKEAKIVELKELLKQSDCEIPRPLEDTILALIARDVNYDQKVIDKIKNKQKMRDELKSLLE